MSCRLAAVSVAAVLAFAAYADGRSRLDAPEGGADNGARRFNLTGLDIEFVDGSALIRDGARPVAGGGTLRQAGLNARAGSQVDRNGRYAIRTSPGGAVAFRLDAVAGTVEMVATDGAGFVCPEAMEAVSGAPAWIMDRLLANLAEVPVERQPGLVAPLADESLADWHDEIAFLLATTPAATLSDEDFDVRAIVDQPRFAHSADSYLDYVEIEDGEDPVMGRYSTASYTWMAGGVESTFELPFMDYYWWVMHPVLDMEDFGDINPSTGLADQYPAGLSWREYYLHDYPWPPVDTAGPASYVPHFIFKVAPSREWLRDYPEIPPDSLSGWGPVQRGYIREIDVGAMHLTVDAADRPTTIEFKVRRTGIVLATTLEVERAWAQGRSNLLENMLRYGPGNAGCGRFSGRVLVIRDREPVVDSSGVIEAVLDKWEYGYDVVDSSWLAEGDLSQYVKIVVPSDQPLSLYQAISDDSVKLLDWLRGKWRILEIHCAVSDPSRDWSGIGMPGGFTLDGLTADIAPADDFARQLGQPFLNPGAAGNPDVPKIVGLLWDDAVRDVRGGDRFVSDTSCAIDRATWWAGQNMPDSVSDWAEKHPGAVIGRTSQANRVLYQHYGNCGELQDIQTAAFRTLLIPSANTSNGAEDHVWSEFLTYTDTGTDAPPMASWHPSGLDWSDGYVNIDNPNVSMSKKFGGGKNISFVTSYRGDGALLNRTAYYAETGHLTVNVRDGADNPVAGATVLVATEAWALEGEAYPLTLAYWDVTDDTGSVVIETGANIQADLKTDCQDLGNRCNNYYVRVVSDIGTFPAENGVALAVSAVEASVGYVKEVRAIIGGGLDAVAPGNNGTDWAGVAGSKFVLGLDSALSMRCGALGVGYSWCEPVPVPAPALAPVGRLIVLDETNWLKRQAGEPFEASGVTGFVAGEAFEASGIDVAWPESGVWYVVIEHVGPLQNRMLLTGGLEFEIGPAVAEDMPDTADDTADARITDTGSDSTISDLVPIDALSDPGDAAEPAPSGCCSASPGGAPLIAVLILVAAFALLTTYRRRRCVREGCR